jgi:hypothetical protein
MEDILDSSAQTKGGLTVNSFVVESLRTAATWAKIVSIVQIVLLGLACLGGLFALLVSPLMGIVFLGVYGFMLYTAIVMLQFGSKTSNSLMSQNQTDFEDGMYKLGLWFKMIGIMTFVIIALYIIMIAIIGTSGTMMMNRF